MYLDSTIILRENGAAHNNVAAFGNWYSFNDTYCNSIKTQKIVDNIKPNIPVYSGARQSMNGGIRTAAANIINTYFFTIRISFFIRLNIIISYFLSIFASIISSIVGRSIIASERTVCISAACFVMPVNPNVVSVTFKKSLRISEVNSFASPLTIL